MPQPSEVMGLPLAPVARATIDAARRVTDIGQVRALLSEVVQRGMCTVGALGAELRDAQIRGTAAPRLVLREVSGGVRSAAEAEARQLISSMRIADVRATLEAAALRPTPTVYLGERRPGWKRLAALHCHSFASDSGRP